MGLLTSNPVDLPQDPYDHTGFETDASPTATTIWHVMDQTPVAIHVAGLHQHTERHKADCRYKLVLQPINDYKIEATC